MSSAWNRLSRALRESDWGYEFEGGDEHPVNQLVNVPISAKPHVQILLKALDDDLEIREREMVVRTLAEKGIRDALPRLIRFLTEKTETDSSFLWTVGNAVFAISEKNYLKEMIGICRDSSLGRSRQMIVVHLSKFKNSDGVFDTLISLLDDSSVRGHALEALWKYGDSRALPYIEKTETKKGLYESKAKKTAILRLSKKQETMKVEKGSAGDAG